MPEDTPIGRVRFPALTPEEMHAFERWRHLSPKAKDALIDLANTFEDTKQRESLRELLKVQAAVTRAVIAGQSLTWFGTFIVKAAGIITAIGVLVGAWIFMTGRG